MFMTASLFFNLVVLVLLLLNLEKIYKRIDRYLSRKSLDEINKNAELYKEYDFAEKSGKISKSKKLKQIKEKIEND